jgi:hypothetical protein
MLAHRLVWLTDWFAVALDTRLALDVFRFKDACVQIAGHRAPFREFPLQWITRSLYNSGFQVESSATFPCVVGVEELKRQIQLCQQHIDLQVDLYQSSFGDEQQHHHGVAQTNIENLRTVANGFKNQARVLWNAIVSNQELVHEGVCFGLDYAVAATKKSSSATSDIL